MNLNQVFKVDNLGILPTCAYAKDACFDLYLPYDTKGLQIVHNQEQRSMLLIEGSQTVKIPTHVSVDLKALAETSKLDTVTGIVLPRSSISEKGLLIHTGVIDQNYTGQIHVVLTNLNPYCISVPLGARIAQILLIPLGLNSLIDVLPKNTGVREYRGFGSSGE